MSAGLHDDRVRDLLADAEEHAAAGRWDVVKALATAALALAPGSVEARDLLVRADEVHPAEGGRRQLTVMFCDVVGSTALSHERDPELVREVLRSYQATCDEVVRRYGARIARYVGDGILVYFGHPEVHEDDPRRAVQAGLDLLDALEPVTDEVRRRYDVDLRVRVAVHTGVVVLGDMGSAITPDRDAIVGEAPNLAARLQDHATPGTLLISEATYELVRGWFLVVPRGALALKGLEDPVVAYEVVEPTPTESRVQAQADLSPFVGRHDLLEALDGHWRAVVDGAGRSVVLTGPPGVGKTRLSDVQRRRVLAAEGRVLVAGCSALHSSTALHPIRRMVERSAEIEGHHAGRSALTRLWSALDVLGLTADLPILADFLGIPPEPWCPAPELEGSVLREQLLGTLLRWLRALAERSPVLFIVDDLQWADPTTLDLVGRAVAARIEGLLLLITCRDDHEVAWSLPEQLVVDRLSTDELSELARRLPEGRRLSVEELARAVERSDGIPLFLEELVRSGALASGDGPAREAQIPAALRDLLLARYAAPGVDLRLAQLLATIGPDARRPVIQAASGLDAADLDRQLRALVEEGIVTVAPGPPEVYRFRHQLLADLAYDTQLQVARRRTHGLVAAALRAQGDEPGAAAVLAHHLEHAGEIGDAIRALAVAAEEAQALGANAESGVLLDRAFVLLERAEADERPELELEVRLLRGVSAASTMGYAAPQAIADFEVCSHLVSSLAGDGYLDDERPGARPASERAWGSTGLWTTFMLQGRLDTADEVANDLARKLRPDSVLRGYVEAMPAFADFFRGRFAAAERGMRAAVDALEHLELPSRIANPADPLVAALAHLSYAVVLRGDVAQSRALSDRALETARAMPFPRGPFSVCYVAGMRAAIETLVGCFEEADRFAIEQAAVAERHGFTFWSVLAGLIRALLDLPDDASAQQRAELSLALIGSLGAENWLPSFTATLGSVHLGLGDAAAALPHLDAARAVADRLGLHYWTAEIDRQRALCRLDLGDAAGVDLVRDAVQLAHDQDALLLELWSRTTLCELVDDDHERAALERLRTQIGVAGGDVELLERARVTVGSRR